MKKDPPRVFFSAVFSNSLNMKRRWAFPLSGSLKFDDIRFRRNEASQAYAIPVKLVKNNWQHSIFWSSSLKNETGSRWSIVRFPVSSSLKNETRCPRIVLILWRPHEKTKQRVSEHSSLSYVKLLKKWNWVWFEHSSWSCVKLVKKWNKGYEDSSFAMSTSLKNETTPFPNRVFD